MKIYFSIQRQSRRIMNDAEVLQRNKLPPFSWRLCAKKKENPLKKDVVEMKLNFLFCSLGAVHIFSQQLSHTLLSSNPVVQVKT